MEAYLRAAQCVLRHAAYRVTGAGAALVPLTTLLAAETPSPLRSFSTAPTPPAARRVAVGVSGGVDSAVAALLLKEQGHDVLGVFMRNWDEAEETGNRNCSVERDLADAAAVCRHLGIPLHEANFVAEYWQRVFTGFLAQCERGLTPNPDLACNRHIKFDALLRFAGALGADAVATGHYARLRRDSNGAMQLLRGADASKDQSYFLAAVQPHSLHNMLFPLGGLTKAEVRELAAAAGLPTASKRSSAGICFIGRRNFAGFLAEYVPPLPGRFVDVDSGADLGLCRNVTAVTHGQRPGIGGAAERTYVAGKDVVNRIVYVAQGKDHPALLTSTACVRPPHWLSAAHAEVLQRDGLLACHYKARYGQRAEPCTLHLLRSAATFQRSAYCRLHPADELIASGSVLVRFLRPAVAVTPQQAFVMYDGDLCLGSAAIAAPGATLHELDRGKSLSGSQLPAQVGSLSCTPFQNC